MLFYYGDYRIIKNFYLLNKNTFEDYNVLKIDHNETNKSIDQTVLLSTNTDLEEILYVDFKESKTLQRIYNRSVKEIKDKEHFEKTSDLEKIMIIGRKIDEVVIENRKEASYLLENDAYLDYKILSLTKKVRDKALIPVDTFINSGYMYCRHYALAEGVLIEKAINEGILNGNVELNGNLYVFKDKSITGHIWIRYNSEKEKYIIDYMKKNYINVSKLLKFEENNDYLDKISYQKKLPLFENLYHFFNVYGNYWDYKKPEESPEFKRYLKFINKLKNEGFEIIHRKKSVLNKVFIDPWHNDAIFVRNNIITNTLKNRTLKKFKDKKPTIDEILDEIYYGFVEIINKYYPEKKYYTDPILNAATIIKNNDSKFDREIKEYIVKDIDTLIKNKKIDSRVAHLLIASVIELLKKDKNFQKTLEGIISIERDDTSFERGNCFLMFYPKNKNKRPYIIDLINYKVDQLPDEEIFRDLVFNKNSKIPLLWILAEDY
ncbi:MAG: hypothetical protein QW210_04490 [Candidatus Woesearchaeota archaeon]